MEYRPLGNSDIKISCISFGAWAIGGWLWGGADENDALNAIEEAIEQGMTTIDTAPVYGFGKSELLVGKVLKRRRNDVQLLTKFGLRWDTKEGEFYFHTEDENGEGIDIHRFAGRESVIQECEKSLQRLQTDHIDLYQIHWNDPSTPIEETMEAVLRLQEQGKIITAGVSNYSAEQMKMANETIDIVSNQVPYSMLLRDIEADVIPYCLDSGKGILAYSPLQRGILTGKITSEYKFSDGDHRPTTPYYKEPNLSKINHFLNEIKPIADEYKLTLSQLVINWTIQQPGILSALVGARNPQQVIENVKAGDSLIDVDAIGQINRRLESLNLDLSI